MKVLITGGLGFIGSNLVEYLLHKTDWSIKIYDNDTTKTLENNERTELIYGDIRDYNALLENIKDCEYVVHLAAQTLVIDSIDNPLYDAETNVIGTINVLNASKKVGIKKVIMASSAAPLGEQEPPVNEGKVPKPSSPYGASKLSCEGYCSAFSASYDLKTVVLRFSNVYGPKSYNKGSAVAKFIKQILTNEQILLYGDGNQTRDLIHVDDICQAILLGIKKELPNNFSLFQIGTGKETSVNRLLEIIKKEFENKKNILPFKYENARKGEILRNYTDITKAKNELGFIPEISLEEGIKTTIDWFANQK